jgi:hypothetical protein
MKAANSLPDAVSRWPDEALALWHERAGIREHMGGQERARAEAEAEREVRAMWRGAA